MSTPQQSMDKLIRLTLVNWYLIGAKDIDLSGNITLVRGHNGSGKSSILDAIQTVLAGGDEKELLMNAASSDGTRSGRDIRSYALGVVNESAGEQVCQPRKETNTYLCLTFRKKDGSTYSAGIAIHAMASTQTISKKLFIFEGADLSAQDFKQAEREIITWKQLEQRLKYAEGVLSLPTTAKDFRDRLCELMSAPGQGNQISPKMMLRTIKKAISFKEQKCISTFVKEHILPTRTIDVLKIQTDYAQYESIEKLIKEAQERVDDLKDISGCYNRYCDEKKRAAGYHWVACEASVIGVDEKLTEKREAANDKQLSLEKDQLRQEEINETLPTVSKMRDTALSDLNNSAYKQAKQSAENELKSLDVKIAVSGKVITEARNTLESLQRLNVPQSMREEITTAVIGMLAELKSMAAIEDTDLVQSWPQSAKHISDILQCIERCRKLCEMLQSERDRAKSSLDGLGAKLEESQVTCRALEQGEAKLQTSTEAVISLLERNRIDAVPVCELASVSDEDWQTGIERFLGGNREALVIASADYNKAVALYREAKNGDKSLRRVKLIKPEQKFGVNETPAPGTAAALIESKDTVALGFLRGLLRNVVLVETEEELRRENRAITRDGMVAGNGAISGGNMFSYNLLGQNARRSSALQIKQEIIELVDQIQDVNDVYLPINELNRQYEMLTKQASERVALVDEAMAAVTLHTEERNGVLKSLDELKESPDTALEETYQEAQKKLTLLGDESEGLIRTIATQSYELSLLNKEIPELKERLESFEIQRKQAAELISDDMGHAQDLYDRIEERFENPSFNVILSEANKLSAQADTNAARSKEKGFGKLTAFLTRYEPEDRNEISAMENPADVLRRCNEHIDRIENAEMLGYEDDARQARDQMLHNFRSEVVSNLNESIKSLERTFKSLNEQLKSLTFNNNKYRFKWTLVESDSMKTVHDYVMSSTEESSLNVDSLFDNDQDSPAVQIIEAVLLDGRLEDIADYRNFFTYDIAATDQTTENTRLFSNLLKAGSGGEKQTPFYVALGASFMSAYRIRKVGDNVFGGAALAIFDEAFSKMDGNNAQTALNFFREIGLQVILAAPPESEVKIGPYADTVYNILRTGKNVFIDRKRYPPKGKKLLESDNPHVHSELVEPHMAKLKEEGVGQ